MWEVNFKGPDSPPFLGVLGLWVTLKKAEMAKTLHKERVNMNEKDPHNHKGLAV